MRLTQYRTKNFQCKRNEFYELNKECFHWYFDSKTIDTSDIDNGFAWGKYWNMYGDKYNDMNQNVYQGVFGGYPASQGYKVDFYPMDNSTEVYQ